MEFTCAEAKACCSLVGLAPAPTAFSPSFSRSEAFMFFRVSSADTLGFPVATLTTAPLLDTFSTRLVEAAARSAGTLAEAPSRDSARLSRGKMSAVLNVLVHLFGMNWANKCQVMHVLK